MHIGTSCFPSDFNTLRTLRICCLDKTVQGVNVTSQSPHIDLRCPRKKPVDRCTTNVVSYQLLHFQTLEEGIPKREGLLSSQRFWGRQTMALAGRRRNVRITWTDLTTVQELTRRVLRMSSIYISGFAEKTSRNGKRL